MASRTEMPPSEQPDHSTTSPYTTRAVTVYIGPSRTEYTVLQAIINQYAGLKQRLDPNPRKPIELREVDDDIGHTLIHFIYTGRYETLGLSSISEEIRKAAKFKRSVLAYCAARLCGIAALEDVTKEKMEEFRHGLSVFDIQRTAEEVSSKLPQENDWFSQNIDKWIKDELTADVTTVTDGKLLDIIEMYSEVVANNAHPDVGENGAAQEAELKSRPSDSVNGAEVPTNDEKVQQDSTAKVDREYTPNSRDEGIQTNGNGLKVYNLESRSRQNGVNGTTHEPEESLAVKAPSEQPTNVHPKEDSKPLLEEQTEEPLEALVGNNEMSEELRQAEVMSKSTDSAGEAPKSKTKKTKNKKNKKKKTDGPTSPQAVGDEAASRYF